MEIENMSDHVLVENKPVIETCRSSLVFDGGEIVMSKTNGLSTSCKNQQDAFINKIPKQAKFTSMATFSVIITSSKPTFIQNNSWNYGISGGQFAVVHRPLDGKKIKWFSWYALNKPLP